MIVKDLVVHLNDVTEKLDSVLRTRSISGWRPVHMQIELSEKDILTFVDLVSVFNLCEVTIPSWDDHMLHAANKSTTNGINLRVKIPARAFPGITQREEVITKMICPTYEDIIKTQV